MTQTPHSAPGALEDLAHLPDRIKASADLLRGHQAAVKAELETRNKLIVDATDHAGMSRRQVAAAAGISVASVIRVLAGSSED